MRRRRTSPIRWSATRTTRRCGARWRWRARANGPDARDAFRSVEGALGALPLELQRIALKDALRASIEVGDFANAVNRLNDFKTIGLSPEVEPAVSVLTGRLAEGVGRTQDALAAYRFAAASNDRPAAAQGRLREIALRYSLGETKKADTIGRAGEPHHRLARRRDRGRGAADAGAALHRGETATATRSTSCAWR